MAEFPDAGYKQIVPVPLDSESTEFLECCTGTIVVQVLGKPVAANNMCHLYIQQMRSM